ncbi:MAG: hypothetical protein WBN48_03570 [Thiogranum sp.]
MTVSVSVLAPGLAEGFAGYAADAFTKAPALSRFLSRSRRQAFAPRSLEEAALSLVKHRAGPAELAVGPYSYLAETGQTPAGYCLRADPVHLQVDAGGLILFDASTFPFSKQESQALSGSIANFLSKDGWHLNANHTQRWYLYGGNSQQLTTLPLSLVRGKSVGDLLPHGQDASEWLSRCNEIQMLMYSHPVNQQRAAQGLPLVNSLWIWGGGVLTDESGHCYSKVFATDVLVHGLGIRDQALCEPAPQHAQALLQRIDKGDRVLLVLDSCSAAAAYQDFPRWNEAVERYEQQWFAPLLKALLARQLQSFELFPLNGYRYRMVCHQAWQFWKRSRSYQEILARENTV